MTRVLQTLLIAACATLGYSISETTVARPAVALPASDTQAGAPTTLQAASPYRVKPLSAYRATLARPLFTASRRPPEMVAASPARRRSKPLALSLLGVVITSEWRSAVVVKRRAKAQTTLRSGDTLDGWTLMEVHPDRVVFGAQGERQIYELPKYEPIDPAQPK